MLFALTSAGTASDIAYLDTRYLIKKPCGYYFQFEKTTKTFTRARQKKSLKFYPFIENKNLCVCRHIDWHLDKKNEFHKIEVQLILSFIKPHKGFIAQTISRWTLRCLIYRVLTQKFSPVIQQGLLAFEKLNHQVFLQM